MMWSIEPSERLETALAYLKLGWALLPLAPGSKEPHSRLLPVNPGTGKPSWKPLQTQHATEANIRAWFERVPDCNIGVITGTASGGLVVVDVDTKRLPKSLVLPPTPRSLTHRGYHFYFTSDQLIKGRKMAWGEILGEHRYAVLPPSVIWYENLQTEHIRRWHELLSPFDTDPIPLPSSLLRNYRNQTTKPVVDLTDKVSKYLILAYPDGEGLCGKTLRSFFTITEVAVAAANVIGIRLSNGIALTTNDIGKKFCCVLPGHEERHPSASLFREERNGTIVYHDWHARDFGREWFTLPEVRAAQAYGRVVQLGAPEHAVWALRLLVEAGAIKPALVDAPLMPLDLTPSVRKVYDGFLLLLGCKWLYTPNDPTPFSWRFASAWCGVSERHAGKAISELLKLGLIRIVSSPIQGHSRNLTLFLPGIVSDHNE